MSDENEQENEQENEEAQVETMALVGRLKRCKSRESARKSISDYCDEIEVLCEDYKLSTDELFVFSKLA